MSIWDKGQQFLSKFKFSAARPPGEKYYVYVFASLIGFMAADLTVMSIRPRLLPTEAPPMRPARPSLAGKNLLADYNVILDRNIFNSDGRIPPALASEKADEGLDAPAVRSELPIQLLGTIVHFNPKMSVATVNITSKNLSMSYKIDDEIENMARVTAIERRKLTFMNLNNRRMEYVDIPEDNMFNFGLQAPRSQPQDTGGVIQQQGQFEFAIKRTDLDSLTQNLGQLLQQARMEPVFSPDGVGVEGFRFSSIRPGSVYEQLGFKVGDTIKSVNGEPVNSPGKAMEMYNAMKNGSHVQLMVERDGREERFNYTIR